MFPKSLTSLRGVDDGGGAVRTGPMHIEHPDLDFIRHIKQLVAVKVDRVGDAVSRKHFGEEVIGF